jgi:tetratricopeptide (TPR) repeat protein
MHIRYLVTWAALTLFTGSAAGQSAPQHIAEGDSADAALQPTTALEHYEAALSADSTNYEALWKASREAVDLGEFEPDKNKRKDYFAEGERFARRAVAADSTNAEGHFSLARALGRVALTLGAHDRVKYGKEVRNQAIEALKYDSLHAGALHVLGRWNAEIMRLSGFSRFFAKTFLGGGVFDQASWDSAVYYMEKSVAVDPKRIVHRLDLAEIYRDRDKPGDRDKAREQFQAVIDGPITEYNDKFYKKQATEELAKLH